jgi:large subunit ribosomal protein L19
MRLKAIELVELRNVKTEARSAVPDFHVGDTLKVHTKIKEGGQVNTTFTVRKVSYGVGVERIFPMYSPRIDKIEIMSSGKVKRARLFYLRDLQGKAARLKTADEGGPAKS